MKLSDLVQIGQIGKKIYNDGCIKLKVDNNFKSLIKNIRDVFLVFKDNRVRYVTIDKVYLRKNPRIKFLEKEVMTEIGKSGKVKLMLPEEKTTNQDSEYIIRFKVIWNNKEIGHVVQVIDNSFQKLLLIKKKNEDEFFIPLVDVYVKSVDSKNREIIVKNISELLDL